MRLFSSRGDRFNKLLIAFTLAEVLITIGIIGIVAELTIPTLVQNFTQTQRKVAFKTAYSILTQAAYQVYTDRGGSLVGAYTTSDDIKNDFLKYIKNIKNCAYQDTEGTGKCYPNGERYLNGTVNPNTGSINRTSGFIMPSGIAVSFDGDPAGVSTCNFFGDPTVCAWIYIDVNNLQPPNMIGDDIFDLQLQPTKLTTDADPAGKCVYPGESGWSAVDNEGWYCGHRIMMGK